jgi:hypothetical protein
MKNRNYSWTEMIMIGLGVLGIGFIITIIGYIISNNFSK